MPRKMSELELKSREISKKYKEMKESVKGFNREDARMFSAYVLAHILDRHKKDLNEKSLKALSTLSKYFNRSCLVDNSKKIRELRTDYYRNHTNSFTFSNLCASLLKTFGLLYSDRNMSQKTIDTHVVGGIVSIELAMECLYEDRVLVLKGCEARTFKDSLMESYVPSDASEDEVNSITKTFFIGLEEGMDIDLEAIKITTSLINRVKKTIKVYNDAKEEFKNNQKRNRANQRATVCSNR